MSMLNASAQFQPAAGKTLLPVRIESTGIWLPPRVVSDGEIDRRTGMPPGWTLHHTGVAVRRFVDGETTAFLAAQAIRQALGDTGTQPDLLISAGATPQQLIPCTAAMFFLILILLWLMW